MSCIFNFFINVFKPKSFIIKAARKEMKPHYDEIHRLEKIIKQHREEIELIKKKYNIL